MGSLGCWVVGAPPLVRLGSAGVREDWPAHGRRASAGARAQVSGRGPWRVAMRGRGGVLQVGGRGGGVAVRALSEDDPAVQARADELREEAERRGISVKELQRRLRISAKAKGRTPWNKGKAWDDEMKARISEATREAMGRPDVRAKLSVSDTTHEGTDSSSVRVRGGGGDADTGKDDRRVEGAAKTLEVPRGVSAGGGLRSISQRRRGASVAAEERDGVVQSQNREDGGEGGVSDGPAAPGSRPGPGAPVKMKPSPVVGDVRETGAKTPTASSRDYKTPEHRRAISDAIRAKWQDPEYRARVAAAREEKAAKRVVRRAKKASSAASQSTPGTWSTPKVARSPPTVQEGASDVVGTGITATPLSDAATEVAVVDGESEGWARSDCLPEGGDAEEGGAEERGAYVGAVVPSLGRPLTRGEHKMLVMRRAMQLKREQQRQGSPPRDRDVVGARSAS